MSAVYQPEYLSHLGDFSGAGYEAYDIDAAVEDSDFRYQLLYAWPCAVHIQDRDDNRVFVRCSFNQFYDRIDRITFYAYKYHICFSIEFFSGSCRNLERMFALQIRFQFQTVRLNRLQMSSTGNTGYIFACQRQESCDTAAYTSRSCNEIFHIVSELVINKSSVVTDNHTLKRKCMMSPSCTTYSFPSTPSFPASFTAASEPYLI